MNEVRQFGAVSKGQPLLVPLADGRRLAYAEYGAETGRPLILLHGTPGGRLQASIMDAAARQAGIRIIAPDRPGMGYSDPMPDLSFVGYAGDIVQLLEHLDMRRAVIAGISGGGGFALACGHALPDVVSQVVLVAAAVPVPWRSQIGTLWQSRLLQILAIYFPRLAAALLHRAFRGDADEDALQRMSAKFPAADRRILQRADVRTLFLGGANRDMLRQGATAAIHEMALYGRSLGFDLRDLRVPVHLVHGDADRNVPLSVAQYAAAHIFGAELEVVPGAAHLFIIESPQFLLERV